MLKFSKMQLLNRNKIFSFFQFWILNNLQITHELFCSSLDYSRLFLNDSLDVSITNCNCKYKCCMFENCNVQSYTSAIEIKCSNSIVLDRWRDVRNSKYTVVMTNKNNFFTIKKRSYIQLKILILIKWPKLSSICST